MQNFKPFDNESNTVQLGQLRIENRVDRLTIYGDLDITRDQLGLQQAKALQGIINAAVAKLESEDLPKHILKRAKDMVQNPFTQKRED
jgi:hypothetical protein